MGWLLWGFVPNAEDSCSEGGCCKFNKAAYCQPRQQPSSPNWDPKRQVKTSEVDRGVVTD